MIVTYFRWFGRKWLIDLWQDEMEYFEPREWNIPPNASIWYVPGTWEMT